ncbi:hypothetical protein EGI22_22545 [Lacihabitans sp. LS3-19]|uniref:hypothetical protein n=1 Tax=Lacihabitans sp. LS3-19 TaxID=2487335 RepID=UPI0020CC0938|nr:hypothetical protein [Lacihabitans sp. LS3-19]MCP9770695.1 hypothetical protein [Lacihabitans sp. LS3-19]
MKKFILLFSLFISTNSFGQVNIYAEDLNNFYQAFDSIRVSTDTLKQSYFLEKYYFERASEGMKKFMEFEKTAFNETSSQYLNSYLSYISKNSKHLTKIRPWALSAIDQKPIIDKMFLRYKSIYPQMTAGDVVFVIGKGQVGGRPLGKDLLIGTELLANEKPDWAVMMVLHEFTHTQQWIMRNAELIFSQKPMRLTQILANALWEGNADHVAEVVYGKTVEENNPSSQYVFGKSHEKEIWEKFKEEMFTPLNSDQKQWFMQQDKDFGGVKVKDIGYFMGHQICLKYYNNAKDKTKALAEMINLNLDSDESAFKFLLDSGYPSKKEKILLQKRFAESKKKK